MSDFQGSRFQDEEGALRRRGSDPSIELLVHKVSRMEASMEKMADAMSRLAVIEDRQTSDKAALERAFDAIAKSDERCTDAVEKVVAKIALSDKRIEGLERAAPMHDQTQRWVLTAMWMAAAAAAMYIAKKVGLIT